MRSLDEKIPRGWTSKKLGSMGEFFGGVTSISKEDYGHGTPFLPFKNIFNNSKVDIEALELMNVSQKDLIKRNCLYGDIFFTASSETDDEVAMSSVLLNDVQNLTYNGFCKRYRLNSFNELNPKFARYFFRSRIFRYLIKQVVTGDVRFNISQETLSNIEITIPENILEQKAIANILTSLDDKIENLNAQNKTLEETVQTVFKGWFGKYQIEDELPSGWKIGKYDDLVYLSSGKGVKKINYKENGRYKIFGANGTIGHYDKYLIDENIIVTGRVGTLGNVFIIKEPIWISDNVLISRIKNESTFYYTYFTLKGFNFKSLNTGSTQPLITQTDLKRVPVILPTKSKLSEFENFSEPYFEKIECNSKHILTLINTRDTLLPNLMSGKIRVNFD